MRSFKRPILWIEGNEDKNDWLKVSSASMVGAFKRLILWVEGTEDKNDLFNN